MLPHARHSLIGEGLDLMPKIIGDAGAKGVLSIIEECEVSMAVCQDRLGVAMTSFNSKKVQYAFPLIRFT